MTRPAALIAAALFLVACDEPPERGRLGDLPASPEESYYRSEALLVPPYTYAPPEAP